ncbi:MAG: glycosyltransferase family 2 protein [Planctomycetaceae bacterium]|jgi:succinoglycan biosynthesis protein ExoA|nr:glycosyltransferase family 2 protein [Planctomycetaceae bacterium]
MFLSVILPVRNESLHIADVLDQLLAQDYPPEQFECIVVDGLSTDATADAVRDYCNKYPNVRYIENPKKLASAARTIGAKNARGEAVIIVDGHCIIDNRDMLKNAAAAFTQTQADCLGRPQPLEMKEATTLQWSIAAARRSPLGHHPDSFIYSGQAQFSPASSVAIAYRKTVFEKIGYFDETFDACEDVEFNTRCDKAALRCYFEPAIAVRYVPRKTLSGLFFQLYRYGRGRVRLFRKHRETFSLKSFAPGFFVFGVIAGCLLTLLTAILANTCLPQFQTNVIVIFLTVFYWLPVSLYLFAVLAESVRLAFKHHRLLMLPYMPFVFLTLHFGFGWGIVREFFIHKPQR